MKRLILMLLVLSAVGFGQNLQTHYDMSDDRAYVTTTLEMFKPDGLGSTFFFVDFDYADGAERSSASTAYWELSRMFNVPGVKGLAAGLQYNDGLNSFGGFGNVWLAGLEYPVNLKIVTLVSSLWLRDAEGQDPNLQLTFVWYKPLLSGKVAFSGFVDVWGQNNADFDAQGTEAQWVFLTEPQLWYNVNDRIAVGGEVEISQNFVFGADDALKVYPTLALKWTF